MICLSPFFLLFGSRLFKPTLGLLGVGAGGYFSYLGLRKASTQLTFLPSISNQTKIFISMAVAFIAGVLLIKITRVGIFLLGFIGFLFAGNFLFSFLFIRFLPQLNLPGDLSYWHVGFVFLVALLGGAIAIYFVEKVLVRILTALIGGYMLIGPISYFLREHRVVSVAPLAHDQFLSTNPNQFSCGSEVSCWIFLGFWGFLWMLGVVVQFQLVKRSKSKDGDDSVSRDARLGQSRRAPQIIIIEEIVQEPDFSKYRMGSRSDVMGSRKHPRRRIRRGQSSLVGSSRRDFPYVSSL